jgi:hypothetical protein
VKASVLSKTEGVEDRGKSGVRQRAKTDKTGTSTKTVPLLLGDLMDASMEIWMGI